METRHHIFFSNSQNMESIPSDSIDLIITSPPYPMIDMWDDVFCRMNQTIKECLSNDPMVAFELMHLELDKVWNECFRVLKRGGFLCINIGDATRTINKTFQLFNNSARIVSHCLKLGFNNLPNIIWRKQTNAPNKFMGSGMLPCGAYVTLEHEWILIFRKNGKRCYTTSNDKTIRRQSSYFWEERNSWFSDLWDIKGVKQAISEPGSRNRNGSFPLKIPFRLINMYSQYGDTILDPFAGLCTTNIAAIINGRNSIGIEIDPSLDPSILKHISSYPVARANEIVQERMDRHIEFVKKRETTEGKILKYENTTLNCRVTTSQESEMALQKLQRIEISHTDSIDILVDYSDFAK